MKWFRLFQAFSFFILGVCCREDNAKSVSYTASDDASWAIQSPNLSTILGSDKQEQYDAYMQGCERAKEEAKQRGIGCSVDEDYRLKMNRYQPSSVYNYTALGYKKIKAPKKLFDMILNFYKANQGKDEVEWKRINTYHNLWTAPPTIMHLNQNSFSGGGADLQSEIWKTAKGLMEQWSGQELSPVSLYGIRLYHNDPFLLHTLTVFPSLHQRSDVDEPWPLEVYGHDGKATNVTMEPGDMVLYESHSVIHGRPFPLKGKLYANVFVHFEVIGSLDPTAESTFDPDADIPPYLVPGSIWEAEWRKNNPGGWSHKLLNAREAARRGDAGALKKMSKIDPSAFSQADENGWTPLHEAIRVGDLESVQAILAIVDDKNRPTRGKFTPLRLAYDYLGENHAVTQYLQTIGASKTPVQVPTSVEL